MTQTSDQASVEWLIQAIEALPSDDPVPLRTPGYNKYTTQKAHWLGWLNPTAGTGSYARASADARGARNVYNRIVEPKMLLWLIEASRVPTRLVDAAKTASSNDMPMPTRAAAIRKHVPWAEVERALLKRDEAV
ncbi:hypothetical protein [Stutzerimonas stutzeri]|uniref:hypothetical protein n=1 Tax=Stutzerimonas stutzeri TaxID=316 RepID=UPI00210D4CAB|nr:hypothetical protein [Stutzerimonas stutzeri]MCQ4257942.1 hypothetical protein [Stutzerimonas stutzeri]